MADHVKLRLIGLAAVLLSAAVLFPLFFDGAGYQERHLTSAIPDAPDSPVIVNVKPAQPAIAPTIEVAPAEPVKARPGMTLVMAEKIRRAREAGEPLPVAAQRAVESLNVTEEAPTLDQQGVPVAWTLQLASFKDETNARGLRKKLIKAGHKVYTRKQQGLVKVYVGPDLQRGNLERLKLSLKSTMGMDGIIVRFTTR